MEPTPRIPIYPSSNVLDVACPIDTPQNERCVIDFTTIQTAGDFLSLLSKLYGYRPYYNSLERSLEGKPEYISPIYFQFLARIYAMAAEFGFPFIDAHFLTCAEKNLDPYGFDVMLSLGRYLGQINLEMYIMRMNIITQQWDNLPHPKLVQRLAGYMGIPNKGHVVESSDRFSWYTSVGSRNKEMLPCVVADMPFHQIMAGLTCWPDHPDHDNHGPVTLAKLKNYIAIDFDSLEDQLKAAFPWLDIRSLLDIAAEEFSRI